MYKRLLSTLALVALIAVVVYATLPQASQAAPSAQLPFTQETLQFKAITNTTTKCANFPSYHDVIVQYVADVGTVNTTTLDIRYSLVNGYYSTGDVLSSSITTDTPLVATGNISHVASYNGLFCLVATPTNTNPITITAVVLGYEAD